MTYQALLNCVKVSLNLIKKRACSRVSAGLIESGISQFKDEVEEICDGADKQLQIETKMNETKDFWATAVFEFVMWKMEDERDVPVKIIILI